MPDQRDKNLHLYCTYLAICVIILPLCTVSLFAVNVELVEPSLETLAGGQLIVVTLTLPQHPTVWNGLQDVNM